MSVSYSQDMGKNDNCIVLQLFIKYLFCHKLLIYLISVRFEFVTDCVIEITTFTESLVQMHQLRLPFLI